MKFSIPENIPRAALVTGGAQQLAMAGALTGVGFAVALQYQPGGEECPEATAVLLEAAHRIGAPVRLRDHDWAVTPEAAGFHYVDVTGKLILPAPSLPGAHQLDNAGIAIAALHAAGVSVSSTAWEGRWFRAAVRPTWRATPKSQARWDTAAANRS